MNSKLPALWPLCLVVLFVGGLPAPAARAFQATEEPIEVELGEPTRIDWTFTMGRRSWAEYPDDWLKEYPEKTTYDLYVPQSYEENQPSGLLLFISPTPRAMATRRWRDVCDELNLILAAPHASGNKCDTRVRVKIVLDVLDEVRRKYRIDTDRTYLSGFSGGGRMTCKIGFSLPEYFGGLIPIGSAGELRINEAYMRKRVADRLSVAFVVGSEDFNFTEVTKWRGPLLESSGVRTKTLVVDGMGHSIPKSPVLIEAVRWLDEGIEQRRELAEQYPSTRIAGDQTPPTHAEQAKALFDEANLMVLDEQRKFDGQMLLKGVATRYEKSENAVDYSERSRRLLKLNNNWQRIEADRFMDYFAERSRGFDRLALEEVNSFYDAQREVRYQHAIQNWARIIRQGADGELLKEARERIQVLKKALDELPKEDAMDSAKDSAKSSGN